MRPLAERPHRCRAGPHVVIQVRWRIDVWRIAAGTAVDVAADFRVRDLAEHAALDAVAGLDEVRRGAPLGTDLHHPPVLPGRSHHRLPLDHVHGNRLLDVDIGS